MVHRPSDSRLLVNLLSHEKEYSKQLSTLLDSSHASLASFSAYASASAPPASQIIIEVAGALAGADEALRRYALSLEQWQEQLRSLKDLEEEVGNIMRDREILVTRLIKASTKQKPTRDGILATSSSSSTLSVGRPEVQVGTKLAAAQGELQACEAHLATKERELDVMRTAAVRSGLAARCKALVECGWTWGEMGKEGLRALETLDAPLANGDAYSHSLPAPPPPASNGNGSARPGHQAAPSSDLSSSSIGPSQSASQSTHADGPRTLQNYRLSIPPAHSIEDHTFPSSFYGQEPSSGSGGGSSAEEEEGEYEVHENKRFSSPSKTWGGGGKLIGASASASAVEANRHVRFPAIAPSPSTTTASSPNASPKMRHRRNSTSVFGSIAAFFHHGKNGSVDGDRDRDRDESPTRPRSSTWTTRTDRNILRRRDDSDDERPAYPVALPPSVITDAPRSYDTGQVLQKRHSQLKKRKSGRRSATPGVGARGGQAHMEEKGWASDGALARAGSVAASTKSKKGKAKAKEAGTPTRPPLSPLAASSQATIRPADFKSPSQTPTPAPILTPPFPHREKEPPAEVSGTLNPKARKLNPSTKLPSALPTEALITVSRNNSVSKHSIVSAASAPVGIESQRGAVIWTAAALRQAEQEGEKGGGQGHRRAASVEIPRNVSGSGAGTGKKKTPTRAATARTSTVAQSESLMSIVEDVARQNREHGLPPGKDPSSMLFVARAPGSVGASIDKELWALQHGVPGTTVPLPPPPSQQGRGHAREDTDDTDGALPLTPSIPTAQTRQVKHVPSPQLKPLRSALRNSSESRSPSPSLKLGAGAIPPPPPPPVPPLPSSLRGESAYAPPPAIPARSKLRPSPPQGTQPLPNVPTNGNGNGNGYQYPNGLGNGNANRKSRNVDMEDDDVSSISSYETTREAFDDDSASPPLSSPPAPASAPERVSIPSPPPLPVPRAPQLSLPTQTQPEKALPASPPPEGSDISHSTSTTSTGTGGGPARRKSVRMSLPPTFSTTPPAFDENEHNNNLDSDDEEGERTPHAPWAVPRAAVGPRTPYPTSPGSPDERGRSEWTSRIREVERAGERDVWAEGGSSDEEDEGYVQARRMLARMARREKEGGGKRKKRREVGY